MGARTRPYSHGVWRSAKRILGTVASGAAKPIGKAIGKRIGSRIHSKRSKRVKYANKTAAYEKSDYSGGRSSSHTFYLTRGPKGPRGKKGVYIRWQNNNTDGVAIGSGQQGWLNNYCGTYGEFTSMQLIAQRQWQNLLNITPAGAPPGNSTIYIDYAICEVRYTNEFAHAIEVELYDIMYKKDATTGSGPIQILANSFSPDNSGITSTLTGSTALSYVTPGIQPQDNTVFNEFIKVCKRRRFWLQAGESHVHTMKMVYKRMLPVGLIGQDVSFSAYGGWTAGVLLRAIGPTVSGITSGVDVGGGLIRVYQITRWKLAPYMLVGKRHMETTVNVSALIGGEQFVDETVGQVFKQGTGLTTAIAA